MEYSKHLGEISNKQFQKALDEFDLGYFISAKPITQGLFGQNVYVNGSKGEFVLRGKPHYDWQFGNEKIFVNLLKQNTSVPVPHPYLVSNNINIFGWEFVIMPRMVGNNLVDNLSEEWLTDLDRVQVARAQGECLSELNNLTNDVCGKYDVISGEIKPYLQKWVDIFCQEIIGFLNKSMEYNGNTTQNDIDWVKSVIAKSNIKKDEFKPTFFMQDYKPGNMVVKKVDGKWKISGLFDFMESSFGHPEADISRMCAVYLESGRIDLAKVFIDKYTEKLNILDFTRRYPVFMMHDRAIIWEYRQRKSRDWKNIFWKDGDSFKDWVSNYLILCNDLT